MKRKIRLTESDLYKIIKRIVEQSEDEYYRISPEDYLDMMNYASYNGNVFSKMKKYGGKPLYITGSLDLSKKPVTNLGPIAYIDGSLNISDTNVSNIGNLKAKSYISDYNSPRQKIREKQELQAKKDEVQSRRENDEWNFQNQDEEGLRAMALLEFLDGEGKLKVLSDEETEELKTLTQQLEELNARYDDEDRDGDPDENLVILNQIEEIEERINDLTDEAGDIYDMYPTRYSHYGLPTFEILLPGFKDYRYTVGTEYEMDAAALQYAVSYIDDVGVDGFSAGFIEDYLDDEAIIDDAEENYHHQISDYPEGYFNEDDFELTPEQEERKEQLESEIEIYEERLMDIEDSDSTEYEQTQDHIDSLQEELDSIEVDMEPTQDMIDNKVEEYVREVRRDPIGYLNDMGADIKDYVDKDALAQGLVDSDGWGVMNSYDGDYDSVNIAGETYYIMRIE